MSIVVKHVSNEQVYVLLGCGRSQYQSMQPGNFGGSLKPDIREGSSEVICVCDEHGKVHWFDSAEIVVLSVDGKAISQVCSDATRKKSRFFGGAREAKATEIVEKPVERLEDEIVTGVEIVSPEEAIRFLDG